MIGRIYMKKLYSEPQIEVLIYVADVIASSGDSDPAADDLAWVVEVNNVI